MKGLLCFLSGAAVALVGVWLALHGAGQPASPQKHTFSSFDPPNGAAAAMQFDTGMLKLADADLDPVLNLYQEVSARTVIRGSHLPSVKISLHNQAPLTRAGTLQLLDTVLAQNGVTMVLMGDASVKAVSNNEAGAELPPTIDAGPDELPDSSSYMTCTVHLKNVKGRDVIEALVPVSQMPKSIMYVSSGNLLILRDYSANVRQMLRLVQQLDHPSLPQADSFKSSLDAARKRP